MKPLTGHQTNTPSAEAIRAAARELRKIGRAQRDFQADKDQCIECAAPYLREAAEMLRAAIAKAEGGQDG